MHEDTGVHIEGVTTRPNKYDKRIPGTSISSRKYQLSRVIRLLEEHKGDQQALLLIHERIELLTTIIKGLYPIVYPIKYVGNYVDSTGMAHVTDVFDSPKRAKQARRTMLNRIEKQITTEEVICSED